MSNNVKATMKGKVLIVSTGRDKKITIGKLNRDSKTGNRLEFVGQVTRMNTKHPFVFVDEVTREVKRHSAAYIAKYIG
jgi:hypothetical protein